MRDAIEVQGLSYRYADGTPALRGLSFSIPRGSRTALLGPNGAGKSTLLLHLNGIFLPQEGRVKVLGREAGRASENWIRQRVGLLFQDPDDQLFSATVREDVAFGPANLGLQEEEISRRVDRVLAEVGISDLAEKAPYHLSAGQKRKAALAGILAMEPEVLLLDEPTADLDPRGKKDLLKILGRWHTAGRTLVMATHDIDLAAEWCDRIIILESGEVLAEGEADLLIRDDILLRAGLCPPLVTQVFRRVPELALAGEPKRIDEGARVIRELWERGSRSRP